MKISSLVVCTSLATALGLFALFVLNKGDHVMTATAELTLPENSTVERYNFDQKGIESWRTVDGQWTVEEMAGAPSGKRVLMLRPKRSAYNVIVAPGGPYSALDVSVRFKPISGREDAS